MELNKKIKDIFMHPEQIKVTPKHIVIGVFVLIAISSILAFVIPVDDTPAPEHSNASQTQQKWSQEDIKQADDFIITMEAAGLVKERKNSCSDGSKGCYYFVIDENVWNNSTTYEVKQQLLTASEIYASSQNDYRFYEGIGYMSGKKLYDIWGIK